MAAATKKWACLLVTGLVFVIVAAVCGRTTARRWTSAGKQHPMANTNPDISPELADQMVSHFDADMWNEPDEGLTTPQDPATPQREAAYV